MSLVKIPTSHFVQSAKRQYSDIDSAIIREAIQNSVDAGSTRIEIETGPNFCRVRDNGCGMPESVLIDALLTMSGSHKSYSGAIGGFGAAKEILLFQHARYEIFTLDNHVKGSVLEYELTKLDQFQMLHGTEITMWFHESYEYDHDIFLHKARKFLSQCDIRNVVITLNGETVPPFIVENKVKDIGDWGHVYCDSSEEDHSHLFVRIRGVLMFSYWVGDNIKKKIVIDIVKPSIDVLCSNRDAFQYYAGEAVMKLISEITVDKQSFGRLHNTISKFSGKSKAFINRILKPIMEELILMKEAALTSNVEEENYTVAYSSLTEVQNEIVSGLITSDVAVEKIKNIIAENRITGSTLSFVERHLDSHINDVDFYIQINDKGYEKIPEDLMPSDKMKKKYRVLACQWKTALKYVFTANNMNADYCIGWVIDEKVVASYMNTDGVEKFLVNPFMLGKKDFKNKKEMITHLVLTACHEVAHRMTKYHDENFIAHSEDLMTKTLAYMSSYREIMKAAEKETI